MNGSSARSRISAKRTRSWRGRDVGSLLSDGEVVPEDGVTVNGPLTAGGTLVVPSSAVLNGQVATNTPVSGLGSPLTTVTFSLEADVVAPGGSTRALAPGRYGEAQVEPGGRCRSRRGPTTWLAEGSCRRDARPRREGWRGSRFREDQLCFRGRGKAGRFGRAVRSRLRRRADAALGGFHGTVSAQNAWLSMIAPGDDFRRTIFANSIELGADTKVVGLGLTLPPGPAQVAAGRPRGCLRLCPRLRADGGLLRDGARRMAVGPLRDGAVHRQPLPPSGCATRVDSLRPRRSSTVRSRSRFRRWRPSRTRFSHRLPASNCQSSGSPVPNRWSVQNNTNQWTIASGPDAGDDAAAQFVIQSDGSTNGICIWQVDVTAQKYPKTRGRTRTLSLSNGPVAFRLLISATSRRRPQAACWRWSLH